MNNFNIYSKLFELICSLLMSIIATSLEPHLRRYRPLTFIVFFLLIFGTWQFVIYERQNGKAIGGQSKKDTLSDQMQKHKRDSISKLKINYDTVYHVHASLKEGEKYYDLKTGIVIIISSINVPNQSVNQELIADNISVAQDNKGMFFQKNGDGFNYSYKGNKYHLNFLNMRNVGKVRFVDLYITEL